MLLVCNEWHIFTTHQQLFTRAWSSEGLSVPITNLWKTSNDVYVLPWVRAESEIETKFVQKKILKKNIKEGSNKIVLYFELDGIEYVELLIVALKSNCLWCDIVKILIEKDKWRCGLLYQSPFYIHWFIILTVTCYQFFFKKTPQQQRINFVIFYWNILSH